MTIREERAQRHKEKENREYLKIAKQLGYPKSVIEAIKNSKNDNQIANILQDARHGIFPKEESNESSRIG